MRCAGGGAAGAGARDEGTAPSHSSALPSAGARGPAELAAGAAPSLLARGSGSGTASGRGGRGRAASPRLAPGLRFPGRGARVVLGGHGEIGPAGDLVAAVVAALGALGVVVDVAYRLEVAGAAVGAALDRAVGREHAGQRACQVLEEELPADARVEVVPGELLLERPSAEVELGVEAVRRHRRAPHLEAAVLRPAVEARPPPLRGLDDVGQAAVAAREDALEEREPGVVPAELDLPAAELVAQQRLADARLLERELPRPLEGRVRLGREGGDAGRHPEPPAGRGRDARRQLGDAAHVLLGLARKADHEVELQAPPAEIGKQACRTEQLLLAVLLLDHVAQPLRASLGREREARLPHAADLLQDARRERLDTGRGERDRHALGDEIRRVRKTGFTLAP